MSNESTSYREFTERFAPRFRHLSPLQRERIFSLAWEECAWIQTLTDSRALQSIHDSHRRLGLAYKESKP